MTQARRHLCFCGYCLAVTFASWRVVRRLVEYSLANDSASHAVLIPLVTSWLLVLGRKRIFADVQPAWGAGSVVMTCGLALFLAGRIGNAGAPFATELTLSVAALVVLWIAGFVTSYGCAAVRRAALPFLLLAFMIPIPPVMLDAITESLKRGSTEMVAGLFSLTGTLYHREGFVFSLGTVTIEVADACSGIRSSIALLLTSLLAGHLFLRTAWKRACLIAIVIPLTILKNAVRIVGLTLLAIHLDPSFLTGQLHHDGGILFFLMAVIIAAPLLLWLRRSEGSAAQCTTTSTPSVVTSEPTHVPLG